MKNTVWVIMGNDYVHCVFRSEKDAEEFCAAKTAHEAEEMRKAYRPRTYWRAYEFEVRK